MQLALTMIPPLSFDPSPPKHINHLLVVFQTTHTTIICEETHDANDNNQLRHNNQPTVWNYLSAILSTTE